MNVRFAALLALAALPATAAAQGVANIAPLYETSKGWLIKSAEQMPDSTYFFKPTPAVLSFGQIIGHVANANYTFCSTAKGEKSPAVQDFEKNTDRAALVKALKDAFAYWSPDKKDWTVDSGKSFTIEAAFSERDIKAKADIGM